MMLLIRHYVEGVGYVTCNQRPYKGRDGTFRFWGKDDSTCIFCDERKALKAEIEAKAASEGRKTTKEEGKMMASLHRRHIQLAAKANVEVREKGKVVREAEDKIVLFKAMDMFFSQLTQNYTTLQDIYNAKGTLKDYYYTMTGTGTIMQDDKLTPEEKSTEIDVAFEYFEKSTKDYKTGFDKYVSKRGSADLAEEIADDEAEDVF